MCIQESTNCKKRIAYLFLFSMMHKDVRYKLVKDLIEAKSITEFEQIFVPLRKSVLARALGKNTGRMDDLIEHPEQLSYEEIRKISLLVEVPCSVIIRLFDKEFS